MGRFQLTTSARARQVQGEHRPVPLTASRRAHRNPRRSVIGGVRRSSAMLFSPQSQAEIRRSFRMRVERRDALLLPGAANALTARIIEDLGFEAVYLTGAGLANTHFGIPDLGLVSVSELAEATAAIAESCRLPLIVDADTGFGNPLNTVRTVRLLER